MLAALTARAAGPLAALLADASHRARRALADYVASGGPRTQADATTDAARRLAERLVSDR
jgi:hypothetical protein